MAAATSPAESDSERLPVSDAREFTRRRRESGTRILYTSPEQPTQEELRDRSRENLAYRAKLKAWEGYTQTAALAREMASQVKETRRAGNPKYNDDYVSGVDYPKIRSVEDIESELGTYKKQRATSFEDRFPDAAKIADQAIGGKDADADRQLRELAQRYADENASYDAHIAELKKEAKESKNKTVLQRREQEAAAVKNDANARYGNAAFADLNGKISATEGDTQKRTSEYDMQLEKLRAERDSVAKQRDALYSGAQNHSMDAETEYRFYATNQRGYELHLKVKQLDKQIADTEKKRAAAINAGESEMYSLRGAQTLATLPEASRRAILIGAGLGGRASSVSHRPTARTFTKFNYQTGEKEEISREEWNAAKDEYDAAIDELEAAGVSKEDIDRMISSVQYSIDEIAAAKSSVDTATFAIQNPSTSALSSAASVIANLSSGLFAGVGEAARAVGNIGRADGYKKPMNINGVAYAPTRMTNDIRGTIAERIEEGNGFGGKVGSFAYQTLMSTADSVVSSVLGNVGGAAAIGGSAFASAIVDAKESGVSDEQALMTGICAGIFEMLFEKVSIGNFNKLKEVPPATLRDVAMNILKSTGVNASEEGLTEIANIAADCIINGDYSGYAEAYSAYINAGKSKDEATRLALLDMIKQVGMAAFGGAVQGGFMGGIGSAWGYFGNRDANREAGGWLSDGGKVDRDFTAALVRDGMENGSEETQRYAKTLDGKEADERQAGQLVRMISADGGKFSNVDGEIDRRTSDIVTRTESDIRAQLGDAANGDAVAAALYRMQSGDASEADAQTVKNSPDGRELFSEYFDANISENSTTAQISEAVRDAGADESFHNLSYEAQTLLKKVREEHGHDADAEFYAAYFAGRTGREHSVDTAVAESAYEAGADAKADIGTFHTVGGAALSKETTAFFTKAAKDLGLSITYGGKGSIVGDGVRRGYANTYDNIHIYEDAKVRLKDGTVLSGGDAAAQIILGHELTHILQRQAPDEYRTLEAYACGVSEDFDTKIKRYMQYADLTQQEAIDEFVADYAMTTLFADAKTARKVTQKHSKLAEAIRSALAWIREKLGIRTSEVERAAAMWNQAFNESRGIASGAVDLAERMAGYHADRIAEAGEVKVDYSIAYQNAETNNDIIALIERIRNGQFKDNERVEFGTVSNHLAEKVKAITGIDVSGYKVAIEARMLEHIVKEHGANGKANHSLKNDADIAKMQFALSAPDAMSYGGRTQAYTFMRDGRNRTAPTVLYEKEIGVNSYYVVEAVPETKAKTLYIVSAFIGKKGYKNKAVQLTDTNSPSATPKNGSATASKDSISNSAENVKGNFGFAVDKNAKVNENPEELRIRDPKAKVKDSIAMPEMDSEGNALTEAQREFFSGSLVTDEDGALLPVYHATDSAEFTVFDKSKLGYNTDGNTSDEGMAATAHVGFWFNTKNLTGEAGSRAEKVYLNITNPYTLPSLEALSQEILMQGKEGTPAEMGEAYATDLWLRGYDGIEIRNDEEFGGTSYVAFDENQIKRTTNKNPTKDADIRYSTSLSDYARIVSNRIDEAKRGRTDEGITVDDLQAIRAIGRKSINDFTSDDVRATEKWARKFYRELGTKSPFFRAWFGDWRAKDGEKINTVVASESSGKNPRGIFKNKDTGWDITSSSVGYDETVSHSGKDKRSLAAMRTIDKLLENAVLLDTEISEYGRGKKSVYTAFMHKFYALIYIDGAPNIAKIAVDESYMPGQSDTNKKFYHVRAIQIEAVPSVGIGNSHTPIMEKTASAISISDLYALVKQYDKDFKPKTVNPALLNEDGTPKMFYHGAKKNGGFTVFRDWQYFTEQKNYAERYAERDNSASLYAVYLRANRIFDTRDAEAKRVFEDMRQEYGLGELQDTGLPDWTDGYDISDFLDEHDELGYDAILLDEGGDLIDGKPVSRGYSIVIKNPEQIKSATDNIGTFDRENPDIRYSTTATDEASVSAENERKLRKAMEAKIEIFEKQLAYQRKQTKRTEKKTVREDDVRKLAHSLIERNGSDISVDSISTELQSLGDYIVNGGENGVLDFETLQNMAAPIAEKIADNAWTISNFDELRTIKDIKTYLRGETLFISETDSRDIRDYNSFRKKNFGRFNISKSDGIPVDVAYAELSESFGEGLFPSSITHPANQLVRISEVFDDMQPAYENKYAGFEKEAETYIAADIVNGILDETVRQTPPTFADRADARLSAEKAKRKRAVADLREKQNAKIEKLIQDGRERTNNALSKQKERNEKKLASLREKYKYSKIEASEKRTESVMRKKIERHAKDLTAKLLKPTDAKHIPEELKAPVVTLLSSINLESKRDSSGKTTKRTEAFRAVREKLLKLRGDLVVDPDLVESGGIIEKVIALGNTKIAEMNIVQLNDVWTAVRGIEKSISYANKALAIQKFEHISDAAEGLRSGNEGKKAPRNLGIINPARNLLSLDMLTPETYFHMLGDAGDDIFRSMRDAQDKNISILSDVASFTNALLDGTNIRSIEKEMHKVTLGGKDIEMTAAQIMELYVLFRRESARNHIFGSGIKIDGVKFGARPQTTAINGITEAELSEAFRQLSPKQKNIAEKLQGYASGELSEYGNEASMQVYGYRKFLEKNYWKMNVDRDTVQKSVEKDTSVATFANKGFTRQTLEGASNPLLIGSIFNTFSEHASEMAAYSAWLAVSEDVNRIRNFRFLDGSGRTVDTVSGVLKRVHGNGGDAYLAKLLSDISIGIKSTGSVSDPLTVAMKAAAVGANMSVVIQQPTAILRSLSMIDAKYMTKGIFSNFESGWRKAMKYAPIAQWKDWGYFDVHTGRNAKSILFNSDSVYDKMRLATGLAAGKADSIAWGSLWNACEAETRSESKALAYKSDAFYKAVAKRFTEIIDRTQVVDGIMQRSQVMRSSDSLVKQATAFMAEPTKQYNMAIRAIYDANTKKTKAARAQAARSAFALAVGAIATAAAKSIITALRDDDREKDYWEKWLDSFVENSTDAVNPMANIPYIKDVWSLVQGYDISRLDMDVVADIVKSCKDAVKALGGDGKYTPLAAVTYLVGNISSLAAIPFNNVKRDLSAIVSTYANETDNYMLMFHLDKVTYGISLPENRSRYCDIAYAALRGGDTEAFEIIRDALLREQPDFNIKKFDSAMRTRYEKQKKAAPEFSLPRKDEKRIGYTEKEKKDENAEEKFGEEDLSPSQAKEYAEHRADIYDEILTELESFDAYGKAGEDFQFGIDNATYRLAKEMALADASGGEYEVGAQWMQWATRGEEFGVSEAEAILFKEIYDSCEGNDKKKETLRKAKEAMPWLTDEEIGYLKSGFWENKWRKTWKSDN